MCEGMSSSRPGAELGSSGNKKKRTMRGKISRTVFTNTLWYKHAYISSSIYV